MRYSNAISKLSELAGRKRRIMRETITLSSELNSPMSQRNKTALAMLVNNTSQEIIQIIQTWLFRFPWQLFDKVKHCFQDNEKNKTILGVLPK